MNLSLAHLSSLQLCSSIRQQSWLNNRGTRCAPFSITRAALEPAVSLLQGPLCRLSTAGAELLLSTRSAGRAPTSCAGSRLSHLLQIADESRLSHGLREQLRLEGRDLRAPASLTPLLKARSARASCPGPYAGDF